jgi:two-component system chemotaxis response regulator CheB
LTCPECGGAVRARQEGTFLQFECHIGHVLTAEVMWEAQFNVLEAKLASAMVALNERAELCRHLEELALAGKDVTALRAAKEEALERAKIVKQLLESEWTPLAFYRGDSSA